MAGGAEFNNNFFSAAPEPEPVALFIPPARAANNETDGGIWLGSESSHRRRRAAKTNSANHLSAGQSTSSSKGATLGPAPRRAPSRLANFAPLQSHAASLSTQNYQLSPLGPQTKPKLKPRGTGGSGPASDRRGPQLATTTCGRPEGGGASWAGPRATSWPPRTLPVHTLCPRRKRPPGPNCYLLRLAWPRSGRAAGSERVKCVAGHLIQFARGRKISRSRDFRRRRRVNAPATILSAPLSCLLKQ